MKHAKWLLCVCLTLTLLLCSPIAAHAMMPMDGELCPNAPNGYAGAGHSWTVAYQTEATCTTNGELVFVCAWCQKTTTIVTETATGHEWQETDFVNSTCTENGYRTYVCAKCGETRTETVPAHGHSFNRTPDWDRTCTEPGYYVLFCIYCDYSERHELPPLGHAFSETYPKAPTCTEPGEVIYTCDRCGYSYSDVAPATGHSYVRVHTKPACVEEGYDTLTCVNCGDSYTETVPALGHHAVDPNNPVYLIPPTCTKDGEQFSICPVCGHRDSTVLPALGHDWDEGKTESPKHGQDLRTVYTCRRCGEQTYDPLKTGAGGKQDSGLRVIRQPEGGTLTPGGSLRLTVGVAGGKAPYSYQWFSRDILGSDGILNSALQERFTALGAELAGRYGRYTELLAPLRSTAFTAGAIGAVRFPGNILGGVRSPIVGETGDVCRVYEGNRAYFCVITDAEHNRVVSAEAIVTWAGRTVPGKGAVTVDEVSGTWRGRAFGLALGLDLNTNGSYALSFAGVPEAAAAGTWELADGVVLLDGAADEPLALVDRMLEWADTGVVLSREEDETEELAQTIVKTAEKYNGCWECVYAVVNGVPVSANDLGVGASIAIEAPKASLGGELFGDVPFVDLGFKDGSLIYEGDGFTVLLTLLEDGRLRMDVSGAPEGDLTLLFARI